jgi:hypothetical protein
MVAEQSVRSVALSLGSRKSSTIDGMVGDMREHMAKPGFGTNTIQLGRANQGVDGGSAFSTAVGASEQLRRPITTPRKARSVAVLSISMTPSWQ